MKVLKLNQFFFCLQDMQKENGEEWEYKDRRQEIVFIGHGMKCDSIRKILDECLLTDKEMALGPDMWKETMEEFDNIKLELEDDEKDEECEDEDCEDEKCDKKEESNHQSISATPENKSAEASSSLTPKKNKAVKRPSKEPQQLSTSKKIKEESVSH